MTIQIQNRKKVQAFIELFSLQQWEQAKDLLHSEFEAFWPQSNEFYPNRDLYIGMNASYPGNHRFQTLELMSEGAKVGATSFIHASDTNQKTYATSYFEFQDGLIIRLTEYFADPITQPEWRKKWSVIK